MFVLTVKTETLVNKIDKFNNGFMCCDLINEIN